MNLIFSSSFWVLVPALNGVRNFFLILFQILESDHDDVYDDDDYDYDDDFM